MKQHQVLRHIMAFVIDVLFILLIQWLLRIVIYATTLNLNMIWVLPISAAVYLLFAFMAQWETFGRKWMKLTKQNTTESKKARFFPLSLALLIDSFLIFSFTILIERLLRPFVFIETLMLFMMVAPLYYILCYSIFKTTVGKYFFGIQLTTKKEVVSFRWLVVKREVAKFGIGYWIPMILLYYILDWNHLYLNLARIFALNTVVLLLYYMVKKETWWDTIGKTLKQPLSVSSSKKVLTGAVILVFTVVSYIILLVYNNTNNFSNDKIVGFNFPAKRIEYPDNAKLIPYQTFIKEHGENPKEYLLNLFDQYDIVVLCENLHFEDTQWEFIYDVVSDPRFIKNAGTIFTEYGDAKDQWEVDTFMRATYANDTLLAKAAAGLADVDQSGHFQRFMKKLYWLNQKLPDSLKVKEYFTDVIGNDYLHNAYYNAIDIHDTTFLGMVDSLRAQVTIDWYVKNQKKCLVITNYRHAFIVNKEAQKTKKSFRTFTATQAQYIYNAFPEKTVNVMLHGVTFNALNYPPILQGKWERIMKNLDYTPVGVSLKGSPFGKDYFDRFPAYTKSYPFLYEDIFFGYIFYTPEKEWKTSNPLYQRYAAEEEYQYAKQHQLIDTVKGKTLVSYYTDAKSPERSNLNPVLLLLNSYHFMDLLVWFLGGIIVVVITVFQIIRSLLYKNK